MFEKSNNLEKLNPINMSKSSPYSEMKVMKG